MPSVAAWLVARPQNAIAVLVATLLLPAPQFTSGVVVVLLVLARGLQTAASGLLIAGLLLLLTGALLGIPVSAMLMQMLIVWLAPLLLSALLLSTRSLTLTLQISVIVTAGAILGFTVLVADPVAFWQPVVDKVLEWSRQNGVQGQEELAAAPRMLADLATTMAALSAWTVYSAGFLAGYWLYGELPGDKRLYGRFRDLNFGRVIAMSLVLAAMLGLVFGANWLTNIAVVLLGIFWLQGLAIAHWLFGQGYLPVFGLVAVYVMLPVLHVVLILVLAFAGYLDAWMGFRRHRGKRV